MSRGLRPRAVGVLLRRAAAGIAKEVVCEVATGASDLRVGHHSRVGKRQAPLVRVRIDRKSNQSGSTSPPLIVAKGPRLAARGGVGLLKAPSGEHCHKDWEQSVVEASSGWAVVTSGRWQWGSKDMAVAVGASGHRV